eukprot:scaffold89939_cov51-Cyclotella_meneghiniana.AAC.3
MMSSHDAPAAAPYSSASTKKSSRGGGRKFKRKNHREPDRLGWMGGNEAFSNDRPYSAPADMPTNHDEFEFGSQSSRDLTPRPMDFDAPIKTNDLVDLTDDCRDTQNGLHDNNQWECSQCTLLNPNSETHCSVCESRRSSVRHNNNDHKRNGKSDSKRPKKSKHDAKQSKKDSQLWKWTQSQSSQTTSNKSKSSERLSSKTSVAKSASTQLWIDKHTPQTASNLCIAPKKIEEVRNWLSTHIQTRQRRRNNGGYSMYEAPPTPLMILVGSPGIGKSTLVRVLANEMKLEVLTWNDVHTEYMQSSGDEYVPYQNQMGSFEEFLIGAGTGMDSLVDEKDDRYESFDGSIILIEEIPNLYNAEAAQLFRNIMDNHVQKSNVPTVFIFSDVYEGKHKPEDLERLISKQLLESILVQILPIQPVTKTKMKKCIETIAKAEGLGRLASDFMEELHLSSGGDLRHAIFALQFQYAAKNNRLETSSSSTTRRDTKLSSFHALGKLLYAKRIPKCEDFPPSPTSVQLSHVSKWADDRGQLEFIPENVLEQTDMNTGSAIAFLSYHSPDFFTDISDLSRAFGHISDAATFLDRFGPGEGPFPMDYASSLGGRAIADANRNPAPNQFRRLSAPKVFEVMKKSRENSVKMGQLRKRLSVGCQQISVGENIGSAHHFITHSLPYLRSIIPQDVNYALANLHTYAKEATPTSSKPDQSEYIAAQQEQQQQAVLMEDDLVDDDDW